VANLQKLFEQEGREKARIGRGIHNRASRTGKLKGGMITPVDLIKGKEKKQYKGNSKVITYKIITIQDPQKGVIEVMIMSYESFKKLPQEEKADKLKELLDNYGRAAIEEVWGKRSVDNCIYRLKKKDNVKEAATMEGEGKVDNEQTTAPVRIITKLTSTLTGIEGKEVIERLHKLVGSLREDSMYNLFLNLEELK
jgi:hypothetical protein